MAANELKDGSLIQLLDAKYIEAFAYYLVYPQDRQSEPKIVAFRKWILRHREAMREGDEFEE